MSKIKLTKDLLDKRIDILIKVIELHPARIGIFDKNGILFYANENYFSTNKLHLRDIDTLHFNQISLCNIDFNNIVKNLKNKNIFILQSHRDKFWYESVFYSIDNQFVIHISNDITLQKEKEIQLEQSVVFFENVWSSLDKNGQWKDAQKLHYYANYDILTGLANRVQLEAYLKNSIVSAKRHHTQFALFFIDLDKFKEVNDNFGHHIGDYVLKNVAKKIKNVLREEDFVARNGGDEFVLIIKNIKSNNDIVYVIEKIMKSLSEPIKIESHTFFVTTSIGIAIYPKDAKGVSELMKNADAAMYFVKENGRNGYLFYDKEMTKEVSKSYILKMR